VSVDVPFPVTSPALAVDLSLSVAGTFPPWRAYAGQTAADPGDLGLSVDSSFSVARAVQFPSAASLYGVAVPVRASGAAGKVHVEVQADKGGLPAAGTPLGAADLILAAAEAGSLSWQPVLFASPAAVPAGTPVWVVAKAVTGSMEWVGTAAAPHPVTATLFASQGGPWDAYPPVNGASAQAQLRLLRRPFPGENTPVLDVAWSRPSGGTVQVEAPAAPVTVDLGAPAAGAPTLEPAGGNVAVTLSLLARSTGTVTIKGATLGYQSG
jgi:hypothetical protein